MGKRRSEREREATAYHEAGHAVAAFEVGAVIHRVSIIQTEDMFGAVESGRPSWLRNDMMHARSRLWAEARILWTLAGPVTEARHTGRRNRVGASSDYRTCADLALSMCQGESEEANALLRWLELRARNLLALPFVWGPVVALAAALLERETLTGRQARAICRAAPDAEGPEDGDD